MRVSEIALGDPNAPSIKPRYASIGLPPEIKMIKPPMTSAVKTASAGTRIF